VDAESIVIAALAELAERGELEKKAVEEAIRDFGYDAEKPDPVKV
jgi:pyruvate dehydrogenase E1 component